MRHLRRRRRRQCLQCQPWRFLIVLLRRRRLRRLRLRMTNHLLRRHRRKLSIRL
jgi:hypothetical protein